VLGWFPPTIRGGANREVLKLIVESGRIFEAWGDEEWTADSAAVRVSLICFDAKKSGKNETQWGERRAHFF